MRIGIFTDAHYSSQKITCQNRYNSQSLRKISDAYDFFVKEECELIVCLGDLIDTESTVEKEIENLREISKILNSVSIPTLCLMGNHDAFVLTPEDFYSALKLDPPGDIHKNGRNLIFLDACCFKSGKHYAPGDSDWTDSYLPYEDALRTKLSKTTDKAYIFIHQNIDPDIREDHRIFNSASVFDIISQSGVVNTVFQGHYHPGHRSEHNGVRYVTLPAMCENECAYWIFDI